MTNAPGARPWSVLMDWKRTLPAGFCAMLFAAGALAIDSSLLTHQVTEPVRVRDATGVAGLGVGQLACSDYRDAIRDQVSGQDDGLYYAFLAWRDGFISAISEQRELPPAFVLAQAQAWLNTHCQNNPQVRFGGAVGAFVIHMRTVRMAMQ
ncbi:MAG: hypothetical protein AAF493_08670 [Pseudomonadota bacterium]